MKFLTYAALICSTVAIRLQQKPAMELVKLEKHVPSPEEVWKHFDTNGDGEWDLAEAQGAFKGAMDYFGHKLPKGWKKMVAGEFKKADKDGSGKVDPKEMGMYLFKLIDTDEDGEIQLDELYDAIEAIAKFSKNELIDGWKEAVKGAVSGVDTDKSGGASAEEIWKAIEKHGFPDINDLFKKKDGRVGLRQLLGLAKHIPSPEEVWKHFDKDGSDDLDLGEVKQGFKDTMKYFGHDLPAGWEGKVEEEFRKADKNGNGKVCKKEIAGYIFDQVDSNDDGEIQMEEVYDAIEAIAEFSGNTLIDDWKQKVHDALAGVDTDKSGGASPKEIMKAIHEHGIPDINDLFKK